MMMTTVVVFTINNNHHIIIMTENFLCAQHPRAGCVQGTAVLSLETQWGLDWMRLNGREKHKGKREEIMGFKKNM